MSLTVLTTHLVTLIQSDTILSTYINDENFYLDVATNMPAITYGGFFCVDDKINTYTFQLALVAKTDGSSTGRLEFLAMCERLKALLNGSPTVVGGQWISQNESENQVLRAVFPCTTYM